MGLYISQLFCDTLFPRQHTQFPPSFHLFTEIGQIFQNDSETSKRGQSRSFPKGAWPSDLIERHSLFQKSVTTSSRRRLLFGGPLPIMLACEIFLTKIQCGNRENHKYFDGILDLIACVAGKLNPGISQIPSKYLWPRRSTKRFSMLH